MRFDIAPRPPMSRAMALKPDPSQLDRAAARSYAELLDNKVSEDDELNTDEG